MEIINKERLDEYLWLLSLYKHVNPNDENAAACIKKMRQCALSRNHKYEKVDVDEAKNSPSLLEFLVEKYAEKEEEEEKKASRAPNNFCESEHESEMWFAERMKNKFLSLQ
nr:hypothetical protein MarFTME_468 [Marseillevirus futianmevirus]